MRPKVGTLTVGTMTGIGRELADMMERRWVKVLCMQERQGGRIAMLKILEQGSNCSIMVSIGSEME